MRAPLERTIADADRASSAAASGRDARAKLREVIAGTLETVWT